MRLTWQLAKSSAWKTSRDIVFPEAGLLESRELYMSQNSPSFSSGSRGWVYLK